MSTLSAGSMVIGTAGHVDHGKSSLVRALTGIDPDRLAEEQARSMTIDLGFAWLTLPSGRVASIVDVPGHERFIKNMLAGVGGFDAALLVIAADEGPMPQTREHLAILDLLGVERGIVAVAKADLIDGDWLDLVTAEIQELMADTPLGGAPIMPVSARAGDGLATLKHELDRLVDQLPARPGGSRPRLPVDRVFTVPGFGTVVTGTLHGGDLVVDQELLLAPSGVSVRVRGLQTHRSQVARAGPGSRVAINLSGVTVNQVRRGDVLAPPSLLTPSLRLDARVRLLATAAGLTQNAEVDFFTGATELPARVTLLDHDTMHPGDEGWVQFRFARPVAVLKGDRFIIRRPSPSETIGGGEIIDPAPRRHRRFRPEVLADLRTLAAGTPAEILYAAVVDRPWPVPALHATPPTGLHQEQVMPAVAELEAAGSVLRLTGNLAADPVGVYLLTAVHWTRLRGQLAREVSTFHLNHPLRPGMPREALRTRLDLAPGLFDVVLAEASRIGLLTDERATIRWPGFQITLDATREAVVAPYLAAIAAHPYSPPTPASFGVDDELAAALQHLGAVVRVSAEATFAANALTVMIEGTLATIDQEGSISLARFRDQFQTSRKYAQAALEYFDRQRLTRRTGDNRVRFASASDDRAAPNHGGSNA